MTEQLAITVWAALGVWCALGLIVALYLLAFGLKRFDPAAHQAPFYVKALWFPGILALWPFLLVRAAGARPKEDAS